MAIQQLAYLPKLVSNKTPKPVKKYRKGNLCSKSSCFQTYNEKI